MAAFFQFVVLFEYLDVRWTAKLCMSFECPSGTPRYIFIFLNYVSLENKVSKNAFQLKHGSKAVLK